MNNVFNIKSKFFSRGIALGLLLSLVAVLFVGLNIGMQHSTGEMPQTNCIFATVGGCDMTLSEHMSFWQQFFTANIFNLKIEFILFTGLLFALVLSVFSTNIFKIFKRWKLRLMIFYERRNVILNFFNTIIQLLSTGVLHPRVYQMLNF